MCSSVPASRHDRFRARVQDWIDRHGHDAPPPLTGSGSYAPEIVTAHRGWQRALVDGGLAGITWPAEYGGHAGPAAEQLIADQMLARAGLPNVIDLVGVEMLGPTLMEHGSTAQMRRHLRPLLRADEVWCQLFSEPEAGSDLAGVACSAGRREDGGWTVRGQKVWTTNAQFAAFGMLLARSDRDRPKHRGLTMFIVPMDAEGITVRPLRQISGASEFNEVYLDDVVLAPDAVVGEVDGGWRVALTTLSLERGAVAARAPDWGISVGRFAAAIAADRAAADDPEIRRRLASVAADLWALEASVDRTVAQLDRGENPGPASALGKITLVEAATAGTSLVTDALGPAALADPGWAYLTSFLPCLRTAGGTSEVLRTMVGERLLGLPAEPRVDKSPTFAELKAGPRGRS